MDEMDLERLMEEVASGRLPPARAARRIAAERLAEAPPRSFPFARLDHDRAERCGFPEVILAEGKTADQVASLAGAVFERSGRVLVTRLAAEQARAALAALDGATWNELARTLHLARTPAAPAGLVAVVSAGTADQAVAEEAAVTAEALGARVERATDCGVAGLQRIGRELDLLREADAVVVVAGFEGALPSVVAGLTDRPVIGVPVSSGYGSALGGVTALLAMLTSCAAGVCVVNVDNGFGAGYAAARIGRRRLERRSADGGGKR